jgi:hypothetical protein
MSRLYTVLLVTHVSVAVLGLGSITSIGILAGAARRAQKIATAPAVCLAPLLRYSAFSLAVMLLTGALLDVTAGGAFHGSWWFRGSVLLLIATGALHGRARRIVRAFPTLEREGLVRLERLAYGMCGLLAGATILMQTKPF